MTPSTLSVGALQLGRVVETTLPLAVEDFFPDSSAEDWAPHIERLAERGGYNHRSGQVLLPVQSFVVRTTHHTIVIDACFGNDKDRPYPVGNHRTDSGFLDGLAALGVTPDTVDFVLCTHLHVDHVGWNTRLVDGRWVPTFPNARYLFSEVELERARGEDPPRPALVDSVLPVVEAGQAQMVTDGYTVDDEVWMESTPGHTVGHFSVGLASQGERAVVGGDLMHSPIQCHHPEWHAASDWDPELAVRTRREFMAHHSELGTRVIMSHFPLPSSGRFRRDGRGFRFDYDGERW